MKRGKSLIVICLFAIMICSIATVNAEPSYFYDSMDEWGILFANNIHYTNTTWNNFTITESWAGLEWTNASLTPRGHYTWITNNLTTGYGVYVYFQNTYLNTTNSKITLYTITTGAVDLTLYESSYDLNTTSFKLKLENDVGNGMLSLWIGTEKVYSADYHTVGFEKVYSETIAQNTVGYPSPIDGTILRTVTTSTVSASTSIAIIIPTLMTIAIVGMLVAMLKKEV